MLRDPRAIDLERAYNTSVTHEAAPDSESAASAEGAAEPTGFTDAPVSAALVAANVGVFLAQVFLAGDVRYALDMPDTVLRWLGANASLWTIADNRVETLVTSMFLHQSVLHVAINMVILRMVGPMLERAIGSARFFPLYLAAGVVASATSAIWGRFFGPTLSFGASGALCGVIGAGIVVGIRTQGWRGELTVVMVRWLGLFALIGLIRTLKNISPIDNAAHIGGAVAGAIVAVTWQRGFMYARRSERVILATSIALVVASSAVVYVRNRTDPYLFMNVDERMKAAYAALQAGNCGGARTAMRRAMEMDPKNRFIRAAEEEIDRECSDPRSDRPTPRIRR